MKKRVIISGVGGFLGGNLIEACLNSKNYFGVAISSQVDELINKFGGNPDFSVVSHKNLDSIDWNESDILVNCAFPRNADSIKLAEGMNFVSELLERAVQGRIKSVINISSQSVYSQKRTYPAMETDVLCLETKYAVGKYSTELLTNCLCKKIPHTNLRMSSLIGPGFEQRVTNRMIDIALEKGRIEAKKNAQRFGFIDIKDAVSGIMLLLESEPEKWCEVYNLGTERTYSLIEIAKIIAEVIEKRTGKHISIKVEVEENILNSSLDCSRIREDFGFVPVTSLEKSIINILENKLLRRTENF